MNIIFDNRENAVEFVKKMEHLYEETGVVRYSDVVWMIGCKPSEQDQYRGWTDVSSFKIDTSYYANGCVVVAPEPVDFGKESKEDSGSKKTDTWAKDTVEVIKGNNLISDNVNHPAHYKTKNGLETIQVIEAFTDGLMGVEATDTGNVIKYICRWKKKNGLEDLKKARWYLNHLINHVEKENEES